MFSRFTQQAPHLAFVLLSVIFISACGLKFGEEKSAPPEFNLAGSDIGCLERAPEVMIDYLDAKLSIPELDKIFSCADKALVMFSDQTRGAQTGVYSKVELIQFLERYFLNGRDLGSDFYQSVFELKVAVIGGTADQMAKGELQLTREFVTLLQNQLHKILPVLPLKDIVQQKRSFEELDHASQLFREIGLELGAFLEKQGQSYSFTQLELALKEVEKLLPQLSLGRFRDSMELLKLWKKTFISDQGDAIVKREWSRVLGDGAQWFFLLAKAEQLTVKGDTLVCGKGRERLVSLVEETFEVLKNSLSLMGSKSLKFSDIDLFIDQVPEGKLPIQRSTFKDTLRILSSRVLEKHRLTKKADPSLMEESNKSGLSLADMYVILELLKEWSFSQSMIEELYLDQGLLCVPQQKWDLQYSNVALTREQIVKSFSQIEKRFANDQSLLSQMKSLRSVFMASNPLWETDRPEMALGKGPRKHFGFLELSARSGLDLLFETLFDSYGKSRPNGGQVFRLNKAEMNELYLDARPVGIDTKLMDPRLWTWAEYRFREANVFTSQGDGDEWVSIQEFINLTLELISAKKMATELHTYLDSQCPHLGKDIFGANTLEEKCYFAKLGSYFTNAKRKAPSFQSYFAKLSSQEQSGVVQLIRNIALPKNSKGMESAFSEVLAGVLHFEEVILEVYDADRSGGIDQNEAPAMFHQFKLVIKEASGLESDANLMSVLSYTLAKGKVPTKDIGGMADFVWWKLQEPFVSYHAPRENILKVFSAFASSPY